MMSLREIIVLQYTKILKLRKKLLEGLTKPSNHKNIFMQLPLSVQENPEIDLLTLRDHNKV